MSQGKQFYAGRCHHCGHWSNECLGGYCAGCRAAFGKAEVARLADQRRPAEPVHNWTDKEPEAPDEIEVDDAR